MLSSTIELTAFMMSFMLSVRSARVYSKYCSVVTAIRQSMYVLFMAETGISNTC